MLPLRPSDYWTRLHLFTPTAAARIAAFATAAAAPRRWKPSVPFSPTSVPQPHVQPVPSRLSKPTRRPPSSPSPQPLPSPPPSPSAAAVVTGTVSRLIFRNADTGYCVLKLTRDDAPSTSSSSSSSSLSSLPVSDVTCCGVLTEVKPGLRLSLTGAWTSTPRFGLQFAFNSVTLPIPTSHSALRSYLASALPGIGPALAERIVTRFGDRTLAAFDAGGAELTQIKGITERKRAAMMLVWAEQARQRSTLVFFTSHAITARQAQALTDEYGEEVQAVITANPYVVVEVPGFGWGKADALAQKLGFSLTCSQRVQGAVLYTLMQTMVDGHVFLVHRELLDTALALLNDKGRAEDELITEQQLLAELQAMIDAGLVIREHVTGYQRVWSPDGAPSSSSSDAHSGPPVLGYFSKRAWQLEHQLSQNVHRLLSPTSQAARAAFLASRHITPASLDAWMSRYEQRESVTFTVEQRHAIRSAILGSLSIVTGIPGSGQGPHFPSHHTMPRSLRSDSHLTSPRVSVCPSLVGKTFLLKAITSFWADSAVTFLLTSPTGRGAQRMEESTGREAMTCHRALRWVTRERFMEEWGGERGKKEWKKAKAGMEMLGRSSGAFLMNRNHPLHQQAVVVDEVSMMDLPLLTALLTALPSSCHLVLVGDPDQLPSVGVGNVLRDLISAAVIPVCRLTTPLRQLTQSTLHLNVRAVNEGKTPQLTPINPAAVSPPAPTSDSLFIAESGDPLSTLRYLTRTLLPSLSLDPVRDLQVLSPIKRGPTGTIALNLHLQSLLNPSPSPSTPSLTHAGTSYRKGDRVMQRLNDYEREVFNGDIGRVVELSAQGEGQMVVEFAHGRRVTYKGEVELDSVSLAWAVTVHKAQGSEWRVVLLFVCRSHAMMLYRSLLYTAVSRAKQLLLVVGSKEALAKGVWRKEERGRRSALRLKLRRVMGRHTEPDAIVVIDERSEAPKKEATSKPRRAKLAVVSSQP